MKLYVDLRCLGIDNSW